MLADLRRVNTYCQSLGEAMRVLHALRVQVRHHFEGVALLLLKLQPLFQRPRSLSRVVHGIPEVLDKSRINVIRDQLFMKVFELRADL